METPRCDRCGEEATIHEYQGVHGQVISEVHLCESCAAELGIVSKEFKGMQAMLKQIAPQLAATEGEATDSKKKRRSRKATACPACGMTWSDFRERKLLGCAKCYETFEKQLGQVIESCQETATHHVGKVYANQRIDVEARIIALRKQLSQAVAAEQYERAVTIRDELTAIGGSIEPFSGNGSETPPPSASGEQTSSSSSPTPTQAAKKKKSKTDKTSHDEPAAGGEDAA